MGQLMNRCGGVPQCTHWQEGRLGWGRCQKDGGEVSWDWERTCWTQAQPALNGIPFKPNGVFMLCGNCGTTLLLHMPLCPRCQVKWLQP